MREHDYEPIKGLPERPPAGEQVIWQGSPDWRSLARNAFYHRKLSIYIGALFAWSAFEAFPLTSESMLGVARNAGLAAALLGLVALYGWLVARSTIYTLTDRRLVVRFGVALPMTINVPFAKVDAASLRVFADGTGDLSLELRPDQRIAYLAMWPSVRPWRLKHAQPSLRGIPDAGRVAQILSRALAASAQQAAQPVPAAAQTSPAGAQVPVAA